MTTTTPHDTITVHHVTRRDIGMLVVILLLASVTRAGDLGHMGDFAYDQATLSRLALDMAAGKSLPLVGIESSAGIPNSPMTVYVLAPLYLLTDDPQVVTLMIALFNVVGVGLLWLLAYRYFSPQVALVAGLAYALHPHAIHYSRSIWAQDTHTPLILLAFLLALYGFLERKQWAQVAALPVLIVGVQIHYAAWTLLPVFAWIVWRGRSNISWAALMVSVALSVVTLVPFAIGISQASADTSATAGNVLDSLDSLILRNKALLYAARLATGLGGPWVGMQLIGEYDVVLTFPTLISALWLVVGAAVVLGLVVMWMRWGGFRGVLLVLWVVVPFAVFLPNWIGVYPHYFIPNLPAMSLLAGIGVTWLIDQLPQASPARAGVFAAFALILLTQGVTYLAFLRDIDAADTDLHPTPLHYLMDVRAALREYDDVLISGGTSGESGFDVWSGLLYRTATCVRELVVASGGVAVLPAHPFVVIEPPGALAPAASDLYESDESFSVPLRPGEGAYMITPFEAAPAWQQPITPIDEVAFDSGATLTGYWLDDSRITLDWRLDGEGTRTYQYFAHFLDANGERIAQQDASFYPGHYWCADDRVLTWVDAPVPDNATVLRVGMYWLDNGHFINSSALDAAGNSVAPWTDIALTDS